MKQKGIFMQSRPLIFVFAIAVSSLTALATEAKDATVFDVRRPLAMENHEVPPKDYYINAGEKDGLKAGMIVTVNRRQTLYDQYQNKSPGDLIVAVGQLKIIHTQTDISVARLEKMEGREALPTLEFDAIMTGDKVDLSSAKMAPRKTAAVEVGVDGASVGVNGGASPMSMVPVEIQLRAAPQLLPALPATGAFIPTGSQSSASTAPL